MKLSQFAPEINRNILQGKVMPSVTMESAGGDTSGLKSMGNALGIVAGIIDKQWTKDQNDKVFDALNDYEQQKNSTLYDEKNGLFYTMQGKSAEGLQQAFQEQENKIRQSVIEKYKLNSNYAMAAFKKQIEPSYTSTLKAIDNQQRSEMEKYTGNQDTVDFNNTVNQMIGNPKSIPALLGGYMQRTGARAEGLGIDPAAQQIFKQGQLDKAASSVLEPMAENNDYENGISAMAYFKTLGASAGTLSKYDNVFRKQKNVKIASSLVDRALQENPNLIYDTDENARAVFRKMHPLEKVSGNDIGKTIAEFAEKNYTIGDHWMGTVTDDDSIQCDSWTADVYRQKGVFPDGTITRASDFGNAYHKAGTDYTPQPGDFIDGEHHVGIYLGDNRYMARNSSGGIHIGTMEEWDEWFGKPIGYGSVAEVMGEGSTSPEVAEARQQALEDEFLNDVHKARQAADQQNAQTMEGIRDTIISMNQNGSTRQDIFNYLSNMKDMNPGLGRYSPFSNLLLNYSVVPKTSSGGTAAGGSAGSSGAVKMNALDVQNVKALIGNGLNSQDDLLEFINDQVSKGRAFSDSTIVSLQKEMDDYTNGSGKYAIQIHATRGDVIAEMGVDGKSITDLEFNVAKDQTREWAIQYNNENGRYPSQVELRKFLESELAMEQVGGTDYTSRAQEGAAGIEYIMRSSTDRDALREVKFHDSGKVYLLTDMETNAILEGRASETDADEWDTENRRSY